MVYAYTINTQAPSRVKLYPEVEAVVDADAFLTTKTVGRGLDTLSVDSFCEAL